MQPESIYHITTRTDWDRAVTAGSYTASSLSHEGFIHASTRDQVVGTANFLFKAVDGLVLLCIQTQRLNVELRYELATGTDQQFPHIYGPINLDAVTAVVDFGPDADSGTFQLPKDLP
jgi:uncharacterized protein (DUF952 family)